MIRSMTGFGRAEGDVAGRRLSVEVKAVNHRFLNFFAKLPGDLQRFEPEVLSLVKSHLQRGQVSVFAAWGGFGSGPEGAAALVNFEAARQVAASLRALAQELGLGGEVTLDHLLAFPAVLAPEAGTPDPEEVWKASGPVFEAALRNLDELRRREGDHLADDLRQRLTTIRDLAEGVERRRPLVVEDYRARLGRRAEELASTLPAEVVRERLALEVAVFADRSDVEEELVRLKSHIQKSRELLDSEGAVGRKLDFLLQEMNREVNTVGSKASDSEISGLVIEMKSELEKIREQVQNLE